MVRHFAEKMHVPAERLHMILGGVDTERFRFDSEGRMEVRARYGFTDDECVVGLLGRFDLVKGQRETIAALAKLVGEGVRTSGCCFSAFPPLRFRKRLRRGSARRAWSGM